MKFIRKYWLVIGAVVGLLIGGLIFYVATSNDNEEEELWETSFSTEISTSNTSVEESKEQAILVDIKGEIKKPGVYELPSDARMNELILLAGGFTEQAEERQLNLAEKLNDQQMIYVPNKKEVDFTVEKIPAQSTKEDVKINLNTADLSELQQLSGVGPAKAQSIIDYREENGPFKKIEDLLDISGFGEKSFEKLKAFIVV